tara:strand:- start:581 stop:2365 length:1785 start_codon:yes stop_codon:yes gene_type:complete
MRYDTSLLKVLEIWNDTFEESKGKLTQSQVEAFLKTPETKKLSTFGEKTLRLGMKKAYIEKTSKLKDIHVIVTEIDTVLQERELEIKAEEKAKQAVKRKAWEEKVNKTQQERNSNYVKTGFHETDSERSDRELQKQLKKNKKLFEEKKRRIKQRTIELNKKYLNNIADAKSMVQIEVENKCTTCRTVEKYSIKVIDNNFAYFVVCTKCEKEILLEARIKSIFKEKTRFKQEAEKKLEKIIQNKQHDLTKKFNKENKEVQNKTGELKNNINMLNREIQYREENEENSIRQKIKLEEIQLKHEKGKALLDLEKEIKAFTETIKTNKIETKNIFNNEITNITRKIEALETKINIEKEPLKNLQNSISQKKISRYNLLNYFRIKNHNKKMKKLDLKTANLKDLQFKKLSIENEFKNKIKKYKDEEQTKDTTLRDTYDLQIKQLVNNFEIKILKIKKNEREITRRLKEANSVEIRRLKDEIRKIDSEFNALFGDSKKLIEDEASALIKNLTKKEKKYLEEQLNGMKPIEELTYEDSLKRLVLFKYLNEFGVWYSDNDKSFVYFEKTEEFWDDFTGRVRSRLSSEPFFDGTRGIDDWASK